MRSTQFSRSKAPINAQNFLEAEIISRYLTDLVLLNSRFSVEQSRYRDLAVLVARLQSYEGSVSMLLGKKARSVLTEEIFANV